MQHIRDETRVERAQTTYAGGPSRDAAVGPRVLLPPHPPIPSAEHAVRPSARTRHREQPRVLRCHAPPRRSSSGP
eukprot:1090125-Prymnesium_polylepis.1